MNFLVRMLAQPICWLTPSPQHPWFQDKGRSYLRWRLGWLRFQRIRMINWAMRTLGLPAISLVAGKRVSVMGKLVLSGTGRVLLGDDVVIDDCVTPFTHSPEAVISIGKRCFLNGTRFGCEKQIIVGHDCILADVRIMDTDFHSIHRDRWNPQSPIRVAPVSIGNNVWVAAQAAVLPGVSIENNTVIGFGSVVASSVPANVLAAGNPAKVIRPI